MQQKEDILIEIPNKDIIQLGKTNEQERDENSKNINNEKWDVIIHRKNPVKFKPQGLNNHYRLSNKPDTVAARAAHLFRSRRGRAEWP